MTGNTDSIHHNLPYLPATSLVPQFPTGLNATFLSERLQLEPYNVTYQHLNRETWVLSLAVCAFVTVSVITVLVTSVSCTIDEIPQMHCNCKLEFEQNFK